MCARALKMLRELSLEVDDTCFHYRRPSQLAVRGTCGKRRPRRFSIGSMPSHDDVVVAVAPAAHPADDPARIQGRPRERRRSARPDRSVALHSSAALSAQSAHEGEAAGSWPA